MSISRKIRTALFRNKTTRVLMFPKGTIVHYGGIPCELLNDTPYESETFRVASRKVPTGTAHMGEE